MLSERRQGRILNEPAIDGPEIPGSADEQNEESRAENCPP